MEEMEPQLQILASLKMAELDNPFISLDLIILQFPHSMVFRMTTQGL